METTTTEPDHPQAVRLYSVETAADILDVSPRRVWELIREGSLRRVRLREGPRGGHTRVRDDDLAAFIDRSTVAGDGEP